MPPHRDADFYPLIVLWGFPELSQTFIHREISEWRKAHPRLRILAGRRVRREDTRPEVQSWKAGITRFLPSPWIWGPRGLWRGLRHAPRFLPALFWMARLPHRTFAHRMRGIAMCLAAADALPWMLRSRPDYLHAHFASYHTEWTMCLARMAGLPWGASFHAVDIWKDGNALPAKIRDARLVLTCTRYNRDHLAALAPESAGRVHLAYHGLDVSALPPVPLPERPRLLAIGRLVEKKGFHHLLRACALLAREGVPFSLAIVGEGPERPRLEGMIDALGLRDRVELAGALPNVEVLARIRDSLALVVPSVRTADGNIDGIPNVILEAMALGRPVAGSDFSGIPEAVRHGENGLLFPPGDEPALAAALRNLLADRDRTEAMGRNAAIFVRAHFDGGRNADRQLSLIHAALGQGSGAAAAPEGGVR